MDQWEYATIKIQLKGVMGGILDVRDFNDELNRLGSQGWELASSFSTSGGNGYGREAVAIFKRRVS